jgi:hypothetical protein
MWKLHFDKVVTQSGFTRLREKLNCLCQEFLSEINKVRQKVYLFKTSAFKNSHKISNPTPLDSELEVLDP